MEEHDCVAWSPNQEWIFKSIKIQPFFPSKEQLHKQPIRPEESFPFEPQQEVVPVPKYPHHLPVPPTPEPNAPLSLKKKPLKDSEEDEEDDDQESKEDDDTDADEPTFNKAFTRPNPISLNPDEPFPPVQPRPIYPKGTVFGPPIGANGKPDFSKPPVPQVRHPGDRPFPPKPVVTDPKKPIWPPQLFGSFGPTPPPTPTIKNAPEPVKKTSDEEDEDDDNEKDEAEDADKDYPEETDKDEPEEREEYGDEEKEEDVSSEKYEEEE